MTLQEVTVMVTLGGSIGLAVGGLVVPSLLPVLGFGALVLAAVAGVVWLTSR
jgi:hypothetical protein